MSEAAVRLDGVGKMYKIFASRSANLKDALGLPSLRRSRYSEFWAVRNIDLELASGQRLGVIGRNGAGKSTVLRLITQNLSPTEGTVSVEGRVQALLDTGGGLHPEFSGEENIEASLTFLGLGPAEISEAREDIAEFTELGRFLSQPFKTYSTGMQARLAFAIATTIQPEILIVDEILGAGDAYFFGKSITRMQRLLESGASVLLVSHALDQIIRFCDETIWLDRGQIVMRGQSTEVVKAYEKFIRQLEDRRLRAKNLKAASNRYDAFDRDTYTDQFVVEILSEGPGPVDVASVVLLRDGEPEDVLAVGAPQDADAGQSAAVLPASGWSDPVSEPAPHRSVPGGETGQTLFHLWFVYAGSDYEIDVRYRSLTGGRVRVSRGGRLVGEAGLGQASEWTDRRVRLVVEDDGPATTGGRPAARAVSRWPGEGTFLIERVELLDELGINQAIFEAGTPLTIAVRSRATASGCFSVRPAATIYRADGVLVTNLVGPEFEVDTVDGGHLDLRLEYGPLDFGDGYYTVSIALYRNLSHLDGPEVYDLLDRSYEFEVQGNKPFDNGVFRHDADWNVESVTPRSQEAETTAT